jgi:FixJ family two-component response regulator
MPEGLAFRALRQGARIEQEMPEREAVVVEDDPGMRTALEKLLAAAGIRAATFPSAEALLDAGGPGAAGCLVLDIRLPGLSGLELYRELRARGPVPPVIFITAFDDPSVRREAGRLGAAGYLIKPFGGRELVDAVSAALAVGSNR